MDKSVNMDPNTHQLIVSEIDPLYGEVERRATRLETIVYKTRDFVQQLVRALGMPE